MQGYTSPSGESRFLYIEKFIYVDYIVFWANRQVEVDWMGSLQGILDFFTRRKEEQAFNLIEEFAKVVDGCILNLKEITDSIREKNIPDLEKGYLAIDRLESRADEIRRELSESLVKGVFFAHLREDLLNLIEKIDNMADWSENAVGILAETTPQFELLFTMFELKEMSEYIELCVKSSSKLLEAIRILKTDNAKKVIGILHEIEDLEERGDELKSRLIKYLIRESRRYHPIDIIQMKEFILMIDNVLDSAEDASDTILLMIAKGYE